MLRVHKDFLDNIKNKFNNNFSISTKKGNKELKKIKDWIINDLERDDEEGVWYWGEIPEYSEISSKDIDTDLWDRIQYWQEYYRKKPIDCPLDEWPLFMEKGDIGIYGRSRLHELCISGTIEEIELEIKNGGDINSKDNGGNTPFELAVLEGRMDVVDFFKNNNYSTQKR